MEAKQTLGPWKLRGLSDHVRVEHVLPGFNSRNTINVARCGSSKVGPREPSHETVWANARLIAAAPELLEAVKSLMSLSDQGREGGFVFERYDHKPMTYADQGLIDDAFIKAEAAIRKATEGE